jgi:hypothetical protein
MERFFDQSTGRADASDSSGGGFIALVLYPSGQGPRRATSETAALLYHLV